MGSEILLRAHSVLLLGIVLAASASAGGVRIVDATGTNNFTDLQSAVNAAATGDVLLVGAGVYSGFTVDAKGLFIVAKPGAQVLIQGSVTIRNLTVQNVVVVGLQVQSNAYATALTIENDAGHVRFQNCTFTGSSGPYAGMSGQTAVQLQNNTSVAFSACSMQGGHGQPDLNYQGMGGSGGRAVYAIDSDVALYECTLVGGNGAEGDEGGGSGGTGYVSQRKSLFASGCEFRGGAGGFGGFGCGGGGGHGCYIGFQCDGRFLDSPGIGGVGAGAIYGCSGTNGSGILTGGGTLTFLAGSARSLAATSAVSDAGSLQLTVQGTPGDNVFLTQSPLFDFQFDAQFNGVWLVPTLHFGGVRPLGLIPGSGVLVVSVPTPSVGLPAAVRHWLYQSVIVDSQGSTRLTNPLHLVVLNRESTPDCDSDGVQDYLAIVEGTAPDLNGNLVPDACDWTGPVWHVDDSAPPGGDGSPTSPFQNIALGIAAAQSGHTVLVADGNYTGDQNRNLDFQGRNIVLRSANGPAACTIDCQSAGRGFYLHSGESRASLIQGFRIRGGYAPQNEVGAGIYALNASPTIADCVIEDCTAEDAGGGVALYWSNARVQGCILRGNRVVQPSQQFTNRRGGAALIQFLGSPEVVGCVIEDNDSAGNAGGVVLSGTSLSQPENVLSHCVFLGNSAGQTGGAIYMESDGFHASVEHCLIAGNSARWGGGAAQYRDNSTLVLVNCTLVDNRALDDGGALYVMGGADPLVANCVLWNNASPSGHQVALLPYGASPTTIRINYCDVEGGASTVSGSGLAWGSGNITASPKFVDPDGPDNSPITLSDNDYRLSNVSRCIDAGDNFSVPSDRLDLDGDGNTTEPAPFDLDFLPRFIDVVSVPDTGHGAPPIVDMGAYERP